MRKIRAAGLTLVPIATALLAYDRDTLPAPVRAVAAAIVAFAGAAYVPALPGVTRAAVKADLPQVAPAVEQAVSGTVDG